MEGGGINRESFRKSVINKMIINGLIATTHPENPNHRNQRYKLVGTRTGSADPLNFSLPYYGSYRLQIVAVWFGGSAEPVTLTHIAAGTLPCVSPLSSLRLPWGGAVSHKVKSLRRMGIHALLFHCYFYTLIANPGYYDDALLGRERNVAIYWFCHAESLSVKSIEADCLVVVETGNVDEAPCRLDGDATLFCWFNTIGVFDSFNRSKVAPRFCCFISLDCRCRDMKCSIFDIWMIESISFSSILPQ